MREGKKKREIRLAMRIIHERNGIAAAAHRSQNEIPDSISSFVLQESSKQKKGGGR